MKDIFKEIYSQPMEENCTEIDGAFADKSLELWEIISLPDLSSL